MNNNTVTQEIVDSQIAKEEVIEHGNKTTICIFHLKNGFIIVESSSCVDPANYNREIGIEICRERAKNKIWELEGYKLQSQVKESEHQ